ncbi:MAG: amidohydrolase family protein [Gemmatimonadota bacterium]
MSTSMRSLTRRTARKAALPALLLLAAFGMFGPSLAAQTVAIRGGTIHTLAGEPFVGTVVLKDGRVSAVGPDVEVPPGAEVIDAEGRHVYPGMFDAMSQLGLTEIGAVDVTNDSREQGDFNPHLQAATAVHPATEHIPVARANGITHTLSAPQGGIIPGQASLIGLDGWTVEEMEVNPGAAMVVNFPSMRTRRGFRGRFFGPPRAFADVKKEYRERVALLDEWLEAGRAYARAQKAGTAEPNLQLQAMAWVVTGDLPVLINANGARDIRNAVEWAEGQGIRYVLTGGREAWKVADLLAEKHVGVILGPTQTMPSGTDAAYDEAYANPGKLEAAGVKIAFGTFGSSNSRTLPYEAAQGVPYGLSHEGALAAVMKNGAEILGYGDELGTIEEGKIANLIVTDGDPLEIQTQVLDLIIFGRRVSTDNKHRRLYEKYRARPKKRVVS